MFFLVPSEGLFLLCFHTPPSLHNSFHTLCAWSPRAETLMKTNARNQFEASSFHLAGARLCTSISTPAGGELHQSSPLSPSVSLSYTHTHAYILRRGYEGNRGEEKERIKMGGMSLL